MKKAYSLFWGIVAGKISDRQTVRHWTHEHRINRMPWYFPCCRVYSKEKRWTTSPTACPAGTHDLTGIMIYALRVRAGAPWIPLRKHEVSKRTIVSLSIEGPQAKHAKEWCPGDVVIAAGPIVIGPGRLCIMWPSACERVSESIIRSRFAAYLLDVMGEEQPIHSVLAVKPADK